MGTTSCEREVIDLLASPATHGGTTVRMFETHGARVFVAGDVAYKIKRPVAYDYMDFSTLEKRRRACVREHEVNSPHAPEIYLGLVAITRESDGSLALAGTGVPVEWAVRMRAFAQDDVLANRIHRGPLPPDICKALADAVVRLHAAAPVVRDTSSTSQMRAICHEIVHALSRQQRVASADVAELERRAGQAIRQNERLLEERARAGAVRRGHGDLHLNNIVLWKGVPHLFDALEFDEALATVDVLYDLAFLLMDLEVRGARANANLILNRYLWRADPATLDGLALLPLFLALRAGIRAMVAAQKAALEPAADAEADSARARELLAAANAFLIPKPPRLVAVGGLSGSGKSTLAAALAPLLGRAPGALHLRSDLERKAMMGVEETQRLPQAAYAGEVTRAVYARLLDKARRGLQAGQCVVIDAVHARAAEQEASLEVARQLGVPAQGLWLEARPEVLKARVAARKGDASDATVAVVESQLAYEPAPTTWSLIEAGGDAATTLQAAINALGPM